MLARWEPFNLGSFRREMDRLFDHFLGQPREGEVDSWFRPAIEVSEDADKLVVKAEVPGVEKEKISVKLDGRVLTISGRKEEEREESDKEKTYHIYERRYGSFQRAIELPDYVDTDNPEAEYTNGVLTVTLPKKEEAKPKQLKVNVK